MGFLSQHAAAVAAPARGGAPGASQAAWPRAAATQHGSGSSLASVAGPRSATANTTATAVFAPPARTDSQHFGAVVSHPPGPHRFSSQSQQHRHLPTAAATAPAAGGGAASASLGTTAPFQDRIAVEVAATLAALEAQQRDFVAALRRETAALVAQDAAAAAALQRALDRFVHPSGGGAATGGGRSPAAR